MSGRPAALRLGCRRLAVLLLLAGGAPLGAAATASSAGACGFVHPVRRGDRPGEGAAKAAAASPAASPRGRGLSRRGTRRSLAAKATNGPAPSRASPSLRAAGGDGDVVNGASLAEPPRAGRVEGDGTGLRRIGAAGPSRRGFLGRGAAPAALLLVLLASASSAAAPTPPCLAYDRTYPEELDSSDAGSSEGDERDRRIQMVLDRRTSGAPGRARRPPSSSSPDPASNLLGSGLWASALWLASGSRSNPIATPLANLLYDPSREPWLRDRNDGLFADLPPPVLAILAAVYAALGFAAHQLATALASAPAGEGGGGSGVGASLQLAAVCAIGASTLELGRVASGEKRLTRSESDRDDLLRSEFREFADSRLVVGGAGTCHRLDVVRAFRRYYGKYRVADSPEYPLGDVEIEQLLRSWSREQEFEIERSPSGFYTGVRIDTDADAFAPLRR